MWPPVVTSDMVQTSDRCTISISVPREMLTQQALRVLREATKASELDKFAEGFRLVDQQRVLVEIAKHELRRDNTRVTELLEQVTGGSARERYDRAEQLAQCEIVDDLMNRDPEDIAKMYDNARALRGAQGCSA